jgi:ankyrin repeat protein
MKYIKQFESKVLNDLLINAAKKGSNAKIKELIKNGVDINSKNEDGKTALMLACLNRYIVAVTTLLEAGADTNLRDRNNRTALMMSSTSKIYDLLLEYGVDVNLQNNYGETAIAEFLDYGVSSNQLISSIEKFSKCGLNLDIKDNKNYNFYEKLVIEASLRHSYDELINYMNINYPQYRNSPIIQQYEFDKDVNKYNL